MFGTAAIIVESIQNIASIRQIFLRDYAMVLPQSVGALRQVAAMAGLTRLWQTDWGSARQSRHIRKVMPYMNKKEIDFHRSRVEKQLSKIGAEVADASEISEEINCLSQKAEHKLHAAQEDISDLYESLEDSGGNGPFKGSTREKQKM